ncbi:MAG: glycoside hydrolase family 16 protein [Bacillota bacterium]
MKLIKHFDFTNMTHLDRRDWTIAVGEKWPNKEIQHYVDKPTSLYFDENGLNIRAVMNDAGVYESARIHTKGRFFFQYGKIDIVAKVPKARGSWPALWLMSNDNRYGHWPRSGEIDIMEHVGNELDKLYLCIHTEAYNHTRNEQYFTTIEREGLSDAFNKFSLLWEADAITYYLNDQQVAKYKRGEAGKDATHKGWPFDHPFYLIVNQAVGGVLGGEVADEDFPATFTVRDIKVYQ